MLPLNSLAIALCLFLTQSTQTPLTWVDDLITIDDIQAIESEGAELERRQWINCESDHASFDYSCWSTLNVSTFLTNWVSTTPICTTNRSDVRMDGSGCCIPDEPWGRCFLRLARGVDDQDCSVINDVKCGSEIVMDPKISASIHHQVRYVQKNIHEINNFFSNYYRGAYTH